MAFTAYTLMKSSESIRFRLRESIGPDFPISAHEINALEEELNGVLRSVACSKELEEAQADLDALGKLQELLATLLFKYKVDLTPRQRSIVREFDRSDDPEVREYIFAEIKKGRLG
jgi:hypothetical protein